MRSVTRPRRLPGPPLVDLGLRCHCVDSLRKRHPLHRTECLRHLPRKMNGHHSTLNRKSNRTAQRRSQHLRECRLPLAISGSDEQSTFSTHFSSTTTNTTTSWTSKAHLLSPPPLFPLECHHRISDTFGGLSKRFFCLTFDFTLCSYRLPSLSLTRLLCCCCWPRLCQLRSVVFFCPSVLGIFVHMSLLIILYLLYRNLNRRRRRECYQFIASNLLCV